MKIINQLDIEKTKKSFNNYNNVKRIAVAMKMDDKDKKSHQSFIRKKILSFIFPYIILAIPPIGVLLRAVSQQLRDSVPVFSGGNGRFIIIGGILTLVLFSYAIYDKISRYYNDGHIYGDNRIYIEQYIKEHGCRFLDEYNNITTLNELYVAFKKVEEYVDNNGSELEKILFISPSAMIEPRSCLINNFLKLINCREIRTYSNPSTLNSSRVSFEIVDCNGDIGSVEFPNWIIETNYDENVKEPELLLYDDLKIRLHFPCDSQ